MKTFVIPAFFVLHTENRTGADEIAMRVQDHVNAWGDVNLYLDEGIPTMEVPDADEHHTLFDCLRYHLEKDFVYPEGD